MAAAAAALALLPGSPPLRQGADGSPAVCRAAAQGCCMPTRSKLQAVAIGIIGRRKSRSVGAPVQAPSSLAAAAAQALLTRARSCVVPRVSSGSYGSPAAAPIRALRAATVASSLVSPTRPDSTLALLVSSPRRAGGSRSSPTAGHGCKEDYPQSWGSSPRGSSGDGRLPSAASPPAPPAVCCRPAPLADSVPLLQGCSIVAQGRPQECCRGQRARPTALAYRGLTSLQCVSIKVHEHPGSYEQYAAALLAAGHQLLAGHIADRPTAVLGAACVQGCVQLIAWVRGLDGTLYPVLQQQQQQQPGDGGAAGQGARTLFLGPSANQDPGAGGGMLGSGAFLPPVGGSGAGPSGSVWSSGGATGSSQALQGPISAADLQHLWLQQHSLQEQQQSLLQQQQSLQKQQQLYMDAAGSASSTTSSRPQPYQPQQQQQMFISPEVLAALCQQLPNMQQLPAVDVQCGGVLQQFRTSGQQQQHPAHLAAQPSLQPMSSQGLNQALSAAMSLQTSQGSAWSSSSSAIAPGSSGYQGGHSHAPSRRLSAAGHASGGGGAGASAGRASMDLQQHHHHHAVHQLPVMEEGSSSSDAHMWAAESVSPAASVVSSPVAVPSGLQLECAWSPCVPIAEPSQLGPVGESAEDQGMPEVELTLTADSPLTIRVLVLQAGALLVDCVAQLAAGRQALRMPVPPQARPSVLQLVIAPLPAHEGGSDMGEGCNSGTTAGATALIYDSATLLAVPAAVAAELSELSHIMRMDYAAAVAAGCAPAAAAAGTPSEKAAVGSGGGNDAAVAAAAWRDHYAPLISDLAYLVEQCEHLRLEAVAAAAAGGFATAAASQQVVMAAAQSADVAAQLQLYFTENGMPATAEFVQGMLLQMQQAAVAVAAAANVAPADAVAAAAAAALQLPATAKAATTPYGALDADPAGLSRLPEMASAPSSSSPFNGLAMEPMPGGAYMAHSNSAVDSGSNACCPSSSAAKARGPAQSALQSPFAAAAWAADSGCSSPRDSCSNEQAEDTDVAGPVADQLPQPQPASSVAAQSSSSAAQWSQPMASPAQGSSGFGSSPQAHLTGLSAYSPFAAALAPFSDGSGSSSSSDDEADSMPGQQGARPTEKDQGGSAASASGPTDVTAAGSSVHAPAGTLVSTASPLRPLAPPPSPAAHLTGLSAYSPFAVALAPFSDGSGSSSSSSSDDEADSGHRHQGATAAEQVQGGQTARAQDISTPTPAGGPVDAASPRRPLAPPTSPASHLTGLSAYSPFASALTPFSDGSGSSSSDDEGAGTPVLPAAPAVTATDTTPSDATGTSSRLTGLSAFSPFAATCFDGSGDSDGDSEDKHTGSTETASVASLVDMAPTPAGDAATAAVVTAATAAAPEPSSFPGPSARRPALTGLSAASPFAAAAYAWPGSSGSSSRGSSGGSSSSSHAAAASGADLQLPLPHPPSVSPGPGPFQGTEGEQGVQELPTMPSPSTAAAALASASIMAVGPWGGRERHHESARRQGSWRPLGGLTTTLAQARPPSTAGLHGHGRHSGASSGASSVSAAPAAPHKQQQARRQRPQATPPAPPAQPVPLRQQRERSFARSASVPAVADGEYAQIQPLGAAVSAAAGAPAAAYVRSSVGTRAAWTSRAAAQLRTLATACHLVLLLVCIVGVVAQHADVSSGRLIHPCLVPLLAYWLLQLCRRVRLLAQPPSAPFTRSAASPWGDLGGASAAICLAGLSAAAAVGLPSHGTLRWEALAATGRHQQGFPPWSWLWLIICLMDGVMKVVADGRQPPTLKARLLRHSLHVAATAMYLVPPSLLPPGGLGSLRGVWASACCTWVLGVSVSLLFGGADLLRFTGSGAEAGQRSAPQGSAPLAAARSAERRMVRVSAR